MYQVQKLCTLTLYKDSTILPLKISIHNKTCNITVFQVDHILHSKVFCELVFHLRIFFNQGIVLCYLATYPPQAKQKFSDLLYTDLVYTLNLDDVLASYEINNPKDTLMLDQQLQRS